MGLLDAYQDSTERALTVMAARPIDPEPPKPKHSGWSTIPRAVAGAFVETAGNIMDVASAYGQVQAATGANANPLIPDTPEDRKQRLEAFDKLKTDGIDWQPEESRPHYQMARDLRPDPLTAGAAENIVFGLTKGLTKAIGAGMIAGPVAGAGAFGVSEGMTTAEDLAAQGVDPATRQKVGVLTGVVSAAGMALPVAGSTLAKTAALVVVGGPASFIAQQAATRAILENADYGKLAQQYDPLDPVGLALATLLPAGFATWAKAGAISAAMKGKPKVAADPVPMTPEPIRPTATQDQVDAAMVHNLTMARDAYQAATHADVMAKLDPAAMESMRQDVSKRAVSTLVSQIKAELLGTAGERAQAGDIPAARTELEALTAKIETLDDTFKDRAKALQGEGMSRKKAESQAKKDIETERAALQASADRLDQVIQRNAEAARAEQMIAQLNRGEIPDEFANRAQDAIQNAEAGLLQRPIGQAIADLFGTGRTSADRPQAGAVGDAVAAQVAALVKPKEAAPAIAAVTGNAGATDPHVASVLSRIEELKAGNPDLPVAMREDGSHATLAEELDAIRRQAREGTADTFGADDAPLIQVAVECMLSMGAA